MQQNIRIPLIVGLAAIAVGALILQGMNITPAAFAMHHPPSSPSPWTSS